MVYAQQILLPFSYIRFLRDFGFKLIAASTTLIIKFAIIGLEV